VSRWPRHSSGSALSSYQFSATARTNARVAPSLRCRSTVLQRRLSVTRTPGPATTRRQLTAT